MKQDCDSLWWVNSKEEGGGARGEKEQDERLAQ